jgi:hypothetical protein
MLRMRRCGMGKRVSSAFRNILRFLGTIAFVFYIVFLLDEDVPLFRAASFADNSVYLLFLFFLLGYYFLWKNEVISGIILIVWHGLQWLLVFYVWEHGEMTLILGLPIGIIGILVLIYGFWRKKSINKK